MEWENIKLKCISILENRERIHNRPWRWRWCLHSCFGHPWLQLYPSILDHFENSRVQGQIFLKFGIKRNWPYIHMHQKRTAEKKFLTAVVLFFFLFFLSLIPHQKMVLRACSSSSGSRIYMSQIRVCLNPRWGLGMDPASLKPNSSNWLILKKKNPLHVCFSSCLLESWNPNW